MFSELHLMCVTSKSVGDGGISEPLESMPRALVKGADWRTHRANWQEMAGRCSP